MSSGLAVEYVRKDSFSRMSYAVKLEQFEGPLETLVALIEARKLEITAVNLAEVTGDFLEYLRALPGVAPPMLIADFVVIAAKLILVKSKVLLPELELTAEEEEDVRDLEHRLRLYRECQKGVAALAGAWPPESRSFARPFFATFHEGGVFYPPRRTGASELAAAAERLARTLQEFFLPRATAKASVVTLEAKVTELLRRFEAAGRQSFRDLSKRRPRAETIVLFLAILHLLKSNLLHAEQTEQFGDIILHKPTP